MSISDEVLACTPPIDTPFAQRAYPQSSPGSQSHIIHGQNRYYHHGYTPDGVHTATRRRETQPASPMRATLRNPGQPTTVHAPHPRPNRVQGRRNTNDGDGDNDAREERKTDTRILTAPRARDVRSVDVSLYVMQDSRTTRAQARAFARKNTFRGR